MTRLRAIALLAASLAAALAIGWYQLMSQRGGSSTTSSTRSPSVALFSGGLAPSDLTLDQAVSPDPQDALLLGAGDIAECSDLTGAMDTGNLIRRLRANSEGQLTHQFGILSLTLRANSYSWAFLGTDNKVYDPSTRFTKCHEKPKQN